MQLCGQEGAKPSILIINPDTKKVFANGGNDYLRDSLIEALRSQPEDVIVEGFITITYRDGQTLFMKLSAVDFEVNRHHYYDPREKELSPVV